MPDSVSHASERPHIRRLPADAVNRIAAGEVVERPAAAVKELVENALDAGATQIDIAIEAGGLTRLTVQDNGCGMSAEDVLVALERHATSKLSVDDAGYVDLLNIHTMGFRGEALPSIGSVSRMQITSRAPGEDACDVLVDAGKIVGPKPAAWTGHGESGTRINVSDLFYATPARLKFMKSERAETMAVTDACRRLAMSRADVGFSLESNGRSVFRYRAETGDPQAARLARLGAIMGRDFRENAIAIEAERDGVTISGFAGLPTLSRGNAQKQFLFVNGRPVKDRLLNGVIRAAYADFLARDRHPLAALFVELDPEYVDVNVHPAKTEVRFRDAGNVRGLLIGALRHALAAAGHRASTTVAGYALGKVQVEAAPEPSSGGLWDRPAQTPSVSPVFLQGDYRSGGGGMGAGLNERAGPDYQHHPDAAPSAFTEPVNPADPHAPQAPDFPLGVARAQLHETYVIAQTADGIVIVDQHAAHERMSASSMRA